MPLPSLPILNPHPLLMTASLPQATFSATLSYLIALRSRSFLSETARCVVRARMRAFFLYPPSRPPAFAPRPLQISSRESCSSHLALTVPSLLAHSNLAPSAPVFETQDTSSSSRFPLRAEHEGWS
eukprot:scaffold154277_cov27-Tisochrysis_lutea.AAC.1